MANASEDSAVLRAIMDAAVDAMIVPDQSGMILRANAAAAKLFQFAPDERLGESVNMLMPDALAALHDSFMAHHIETGENGSTIWAATSNGCARTGPCLHWTRSTKHPGNIN